MTEIARLKKALEEADNKNSVLLAKNSVLLDKGSIEAELDKIIDDTSV